MIDEVWNRIQHEHGKSFIQMRGKEFTYSVSGNILYLNSTNRSITKKVIEEALQFVPLENTVPIQYLQAPSYMYAILMDE